MTVKGIDEDWSKADPATLYADGYRFAIGYVSQDNTGKNITRAQIDALHAAGLAVGIVYEYNPDSAIGGHAQGIVDAGIAVRGAQQLGVPAGTTIYFAVDFNITAGEMETALAYLEGAETVCDSAGYGVGVYGGYPLCHYLASQQQGFDMWQTYAWSAGNWEPAAQVRQVLNGVHEAGANIDLDTVIILNNAGFWGTGTPAANGKPLQVDGQLGPLTIRRWQHIMGTTEDGIITQPPGYSYLVASVQRALNSKNAAGLAVDGQGINQDGHTVYHTTRALQAYLGTPQDGILSLPTSLCVSALQRRLNTGRF